MKVEIFKAMDESDYRNALIIQINGKTVFSAVDGEPEDNSLCRNFGDCYGIGDLMIQAYKAGLEKEEFEITDKKIDWAEMFEL